MFSVVLIPLLISAAVPTTGSAATRPALDDPPVRVSLNHHTFQRGDQARVTVSVRDDGYLVVLHVAPSGLVRVLYPLDPGDDNFVRGRQRYEIRSRGDREAFRIDDQNGSGTVYAAWSAEPFRFDDYARDGHWDYRFVGDSALPNDPEQGFTNLVQHMATGHFDYDLVSYDIGRQVAYSRPASVYLTPSACWDAWDPWSYCGGYGYPYYGSGFSISVGFFGYPRYRPYYYRPWWYDPYYYGYAPYYYPRYYGPSIYYRPYVGYVPASPYRWKPGGIGGGGGGGVGYRQRDAFATSHQGSSPLFVASRFNQGGRSSRAIPYRVPGSWTSPAAVRGMQPRPVNQRGVERRVPTSVGPENGGRRQPVNVSPPRGNGGRRAAPAAPAREPRHPAPVAPRRPDGVELRSVPTVRQYEPPTRVSAPTPRAGPPSRVVEPAPRTVDRPRYEPPPRAVERPRYEAPAPSRAEPRYEPPARVERRSEPQPRYEAPAPRVERSSPPPRVERSSPPPRASSPAPASRPSSGGRRRP